MSKFKDLYCIWNSESYDIGIEGYQTKAVGLKSVMGLLNLEQNNVLVIGDNYNDESMMSVGGISVTADKSRVDGDFWVPLNDKKLPAAVLMNKILSLI